MCWDPQRKPTFWGFVQKQAIACPIVRKCDSLGRKTRPSLHTTRVHTKWFVQGLWQPTNKELMQFMWLQTSIAI